MSKEHGERLQREIDGMLCGEDNRNALMHTFREMRGEDIDVAWDLMLMGALRRIRERGEVVEVFDEAERQRKIEARVERSFQRLVGR